MRFFFAACLFCVGAVASAQVNEIPGIKLSTPPRIDGVVEPSEWPAEARHTGGFDERTGARSPENTEYFFAYDDKFVYFAAKAEDSDPKTIRAVEYRSNVSMQGDDFVGIYLDVFGNLAEANQFEINPRGATNLRIAGGRAAKREWLGEILAKGRLTPTGYEVEARIPWALMRLPGAGKRDMRIGAYRYISRLGRVYISIDIAGGKIQNIPYWKGIEVPAIDAERLLKLLPYLYVGMDRDKPVVNAGADFKTHLSSGLEVVGSINPDFRNIENQVLSLDFSYFERLAGESRPFFLEGQDFFRTSGDTPLFASQRIDNFDLGLKAFGKLSDKTGVAVLNASDFTRRNDAVAVLRHNFDERTSLRVAGASRNTPGLNNLGTFLQFGKQIGSIDYFAQYMNTDDTVLGQGHRTNFGLSIDQPGVNGYIEYEAIHPNFMPRLGFAPERDFKGVEGALTFSKLYDKGPLMESRIAFEGESFTRYNSSAMYRRQGRVSVGAGLRNQLGVWASAFHREFRGFKDRLYFFELEMPRNDPYRNWELEYEVGNIAGVNYSSFGPEFRYRPVQNLQLAGSFQQVRHTDTRTQTILSANYDINAFDSISGRLIQRDGNLNAYLAYRRTGNRGNEYFLILGDPNAEKFRFSIVAKAVFPMNLRF